MQRSERSIRVQALILTHTNYGECDRFVRMLTPDHGKISALARGVRKMNSRKSGHLEPFTLISAQLVQGRSDVWIVSQVATIETFAHLSESLERTVLASYAAELADRFSDEETETRDLFNLTVHTMRRLNSSADPYPAIRLFDFTLLNLAGFRPRLRDCVGCGREIQPEAQYFSALMGGVLCPSCGHLDQQALPITMRTLKFFRYYQAHSYQDQDLIIWPEELRPEADRILNHYYTYVLERKINSSEFLRKVQ